MKLLITLLFLLVAVNLNAQNPASIIGEWVFSKPLNKDIDEVRMAYIKEEVGGKWKFHFESDGKFHSYMMGEKTSGEWIFRDSNILVITGIEGGPQELEVLNSTENELALRLGLGKFLLTRIKEEK